MFRACVCMPLTWGRCCPLKEGYANPLHLGTLYKSVVLDLAVEGAGKDTCTNRAEYEAVSCCLSLKVGGV